MKNRKYSFIDRIRFEIGEVQNWFYCVTHGMRRCATCRIMDKLVVSGECHDCHVERLLADHEEINSHETAKYLDPYYGDGPLDCF